MATMPDGETRHEVDLDDDEYDDEPVCPHCKGDGRDPYNDYLLPCPLCLGDPL